MRLAILISGRINGDKKYHDSIMYLLKNINYDSIDFYISYEKNTDDETVSSVIQLYNPKQIVRSDENIYQFQLTNHDNICINDKSYHKRSETNPHNLMCMHYNRFNLYQMLLNHNYDLVISTRMDFIYDETLSIDYEDIINNDYLYIPKTEADFGGINDQFAVGKLNSILLYSNLYSNLLNLLDSGVTFHPETLLMHHIKSSNIKIKRFSLQYHAIRF